MKKFCNLLLSVSFFLFLISCDYHISKEKIPDIIADAQKGDQEALYLLCHYCGLKQPQLDSLKTVYGDKYPEVRICTLKIQNPKKRSGKSLGNGSIFSTIQKSISKKGQAVCYIRSLGIREILFMRVFSVLENGLAHYIFFQYLSY